MKIYQFKTTLLLLAFVLITHFASAQNLSNEIDSITRKDDANALATVLTQENINECYHDYSALSIAIRNNAPKCIDLLLEKGADVNKACNNYKPPMFFAVKYGDLKMVDKFVMKGAKLNISYNDESLIEYANRYKKEDIVKYLESNK